jgi:putative sporulation protein YtaF
MLAVTMLILALAVSFDGFGTGVSYGIRKIRIPALSIIIIAICSATIMFLSMQLGNVLFHWLPQRAANGVGAFILIAVGIWAIIQAWIQQAGDDDEVEEPKKLLYLELRRLGLVIEILRRPARADLDRSGNISPMEAVVLGTALSLDAFGAGIGARLVGLPALPTAAVIGAACGLFLFAGLRLGFVLASKQRLQRLTLLPGIVLILIGMFKLF